MIITAEQIVKLIERKRDINEHLMVKAYAENDWTTFGNHTQRRDALQELINEIQREDTYSKMVPTYLDYLDTPYRPTDGRETPDWVMQLRPDY